MVLLVVDAQSLITNNKLFQFELYVENQNKLISTARENKIEVIYVRHNDGPGEELTKGNPGYEIYKDFCPMADERIFDKKVNSPFKESGLLHYLQDKKENTIIVTGLQTDYCIDATIKCGFEHGFHVVVPAYANTTVDNMFIKADVTYEYYNEFIWKNRYAECISVEETISMMCKNRKSQ